MSLRRIAFGLGGSVPRLWLKSNYRLCTSASVSVNRLHVQTNNKESPVNNNDPSKIQDEHIELSTAKSYRERIGVLWKKYRYVFVLTYLSVYGATLSGLFYTLDSGLLTASTMGLESSDVIEKVCY